MSDQKINAAAKKPPLGMIPAAAQIGPSRVYGYGGRRYAPGNFYLATLDDGAGERYVSAALRHLAAMQQSDGLHTPESLATLDPESGLPHLDHVICGLQMLRTIMVKCGALPEDPGIGNEPPMRLSAHDVDDACDCRDCVRTQTTGPLVGTPEPQPQFEVVARADVAGRPARYYGSAEFDISVLQKFARLYIKGMRFTSDPDSEQGDVAIVDNGVQS